jgi:hypothetical protein
MTAQQHDAELVRSRHELERNISRNSAQAKANGKHTAFAALSHHNPCAVTPQPMRSDQITGATQNQHRHSQLAPHLHSAPASSSVPAVELQHWPDWHGCVCGSVTRQDNTVLTQA